MKKTLFSLLVVAVVLFGAAAGARAQSAAVVHVPFSFIASGKVLPAGDYRIMPDRMDHSMLTITGLGKDAPSVFLATTDVPDSSSREADARIIFKSFHGQRFLWQVQVPGTNAREVELRDVSMERALVKLNLTPAEPALGSAK